MMMTVIVVVMVVMIVMIRTVVIVMIVVVSDAGTAHGATGCNCSRRRIFPAFLSLTSLTMIAATTAARARDIKIVASIYTAPF